MPHRTVEKKIMGDRQARWTKHMAITGVCFQWRDCGSYDREEINLNGSASWTQQWVSTATEKQPPIHYAQ